MTEIRFNYASVLEEVRLLEEMLTPFLEPTARDVLSAFRTDLENIQGQATGNHRWEIRTNRPIKTVPAAGEFAPPKKSRHSAFLEVCCVWDIQNVPLTSAKRRKRSALPTHFRLNDNASTKLRLLEADDESGAIQELAMWRVEIGDAKAPGSQFHVQISGDRAGNPFPASLDIPRLHSLVATPLAAIDVAMLELFPEHWKLASERHPRAHRWGDIQKDRAGKLLEWTTQRLGDAAVAPWSALKRAKAEMLVFGD